MLIKIADLLKNEYIKKGKLGKETGEGFINTLVLMWPFDPMTTV
jgi:hypothetical protein